MLFLPIVLLCLVARVISEQCFSDSYGYDVAGFCLSDYYNKMVLPRDEDDISLVNFTDIVLKDVNQFNNEDDAIQLRLFVWLSWFDPRIRVIDQQINGSGNGINAIWIPAIELNGIIQGLFDPGKNKFFFGVVEDRVDYYSTLDVTIKCPTNYHDFPFEV